MLTSRILFPTQLLYLFSCSGYCILQNFGYKGFLLFIFLTVCLSGFLPENLIISDQTDSFMVWLHFFFSAGFQKRQRSVAFLYWSFFFRRNSMGCTADRSSDFFWISFLRSSRRSFLCICFQKKWSSWSLWMGRRVSLNMVVMIIWWR